MTQRDQSGSARPAGSSIARASLVMFLGTLTSRILGFIRSPLLLGLAIGINYPASNAFDVANKLPNQIYLVVAGGVLNAVLVPAIVRAITNDADRGKGFVSRLLSLGAVVLAAITLILTAASALLINLFAGTMTPEWKSVAIGFAFWCIPQVFFYGMYTLIGQVLNAREKFGPYMWAPALNNLVAIAGIIFFILTYGKASDATAADVAVWSSGRIAFLGGVSTLGIASQALILLIPLRKLGYRFSLRIQLRGSGLGKVGTTGYWAFLAMLLGIVQSIFISNIAAFAASKNSDLTVAGNAAYSNSYLVFTLPTSLVVVSLVTAMFTRMSTHAAKGDIAGVRRDLDSTVRATAAFTTIVSGMMIVLAGPIMRILAGTVSSAEVASMSVVLACLAGGLIGVGTFTAAQRVFFAFEDTRGVFFAQLPLMIASFIGFIATLALPPKMIVPAAALVVTAVNIAIAIRTLIKLRTHIGHVGLAPIFAAHIRLLLAALPALAVGWLTLRLLGGPEVGSVSGAVIQVIGVGALMALIYLVGMRALGSRELRLLGSPLVGAARKIGGPRLAQPLAKIMMLPPSAAAPTATTPKADPAPSEHSSTDRDNTYDDAAATAGLADRTSVLAPIPPDGVTPPPPPPPVPGLTSVSPAASATPADHQTDYQADYQAAPSDAKITLKGDNPRQNDTVELASLTTATPQWPNRQQHKVDISVHQGPGYVGQVIASQYILDDCDPTPAVYRTAGAQLWRGRDHVMARDVLILAIPENVEHFSASLDAARMLAALDDPRIAAPIEVLREAGIGWVIYPRIMGRPLPELTEPQTMDEAQVRSIIGEVAGALEVARDHGVRHLCLSTEFIYLTTDAKVVLTGLAVAGALSGAAERITSPFARTKADVAGLAAMVRELTVPNQLVGDLAQVASIDDSTIPTSPAAVVRLLGPWAAISSDIAPDEAAIPAVAPHDAQFAAATSDSPDDDAPAGPTSAASDDTPDTPGEDTPGEDTPGAPTGEFDANAGKDDVTPLPAPPSIPGHPLPGGPGGTPATAQPVIFTPDPQRLATLEMWHPHNRPISDPPALGEILPEPGAASDSTEEAGPAITRSATDARHDDPATTQIKRATLALGGLFNRSQTDPESEPQPHSESRAQTPPAPATPSAQLNAGEIASPPLPGEGYPTQAYPVDPADAGSPIYRVSDASPQRTSIKAPPPPPPADNPASIFSPVSSPARDARAASSYHNPWESPENYYQHDADSAPGAGLPFESVVGTAVPPRTGGAGRPEQKRTQRSRGLRIPSAAIAMLVGLIAVVVLAIWAVRTLFAPPPEVEINRPSPTQSQSETSEAGGNGGDGGHNTGAPAQAGAPVISTITLLNPETDDPGADNPEAVARLVDNDPDHGWSSWWYGDKNYLGRSGLGLKVTFDKPTTLSAIDMTISGNGGLVELHPGNDENGQGEVLAQSAMSAKTTLAPAQPLTKVDSVVVWFRELPVAADGKFRIDLVNLTAR